MSQWVWGCLKRCGRACPDVSGALAVGGVVEEDQALQACLALCPRCDGVSTTATLATAWRQRVAA